MDRVTAYIRFTVGFIGLGYIALWPLIAHDSGLAGLPAASLHLSPGLHMLGLMSAACVVFCVALHGLRRLRRAAATDTPADAGLRKTYPPLFRPKPPPPPLRSVKPRRQFGLRGQPR